MFRNGATNPREHVIKVEIDERPKRLIVPEHDQYRTPEGAAAMTSGWPATEIVVVPGADHFLAGFSRRVADLTIEYFDRFRPA